MNEKLNHTNLCMDEISSFCKKKSNLFLLLKKNDFDLSKYYICFVGCKKMVFNDKNLDLFCYKKKIDFFL